MNSYLGRALARLTLTAGAVLVLVAVGQPLNSDHAAGGNGHALLSIEPSPITHLLRFGADALVVEKACDAADATAGSARDSAAAALARSAGRMRWLLTTPSASRRGCGIAGCTG